MTSLQRCKSCGGRCNTQLRHEWLSTFATENGRLKAKSIAGCLTRALQGIGLKRNLENIDLETKCVLQLVLLLDGLKSFLNVSSGCNRAQASLTSRSDRDPPNNKLAAGGNTRYASPATKR